MRFVLPPLRRPRHPVARVLLTLVGLAVLGALMVFGLLALTVFLAVGGVLMLVRAWRQARSPQQRPHDIGRNRGDVLEGEFVVVRERRHAHHH